MSRSLHRSRAVATVFGLLLISASACSSADRSSADLGSTTEATTTGGAQAWTFTGAGEPPGDVVALLRPGDIELLAWGRVGGEPWALVTWDLVEEGYPPLTCTEVLPLQGEGYCATTEGLGADVMFPPRAYALGDGGLIVIHTALGVDQVSVESPTGTQIIKIHGGADGYPPTGVLPTSGHTAEGAMAALDAIGNQVGVPRMFSFTESEFLETPLPA